MKRVMKLATILAGLCLAAAGPLAAATNDLTAALQRGLIEEEANHNLPAAIQAYSGIAARFDEDRRLAATAIFRLGECYRKQGATNDAAAQYQRILREFTDQQPLATLSRQNLAGLGATTAVPAATVADAARQEEKRLLGEEIQLAEKKVETTRKMQATGQASSDVVDAALRDVLELKRQLAALEANAGQAAPAGSPETKAGGALVTATEAEEITRIRELIKNSPDLINAKDKDATLLHRAAGKGQLVVARYLLENGADVNTRLNETATPLYQAAIQGHRAMVELLLGHGAAVDAVDSAGKTALHLVAARGYKSVGEVLLAAKANPNARDRYGRTPLHAAAAAGQTVMVELLLAQQADLNARDTGLPKGEALQSYADTRNAPPLVTAILAQQLEVVKLLLAHHAEVNLTCEAQAQGLTSRGPPCNLQAHPLDVAVAGGPAAIVEALLRAGADPNAPGTLLDGAPSTPLLMAVRRRAEDLTRLLLAAKANPNTPDEFGRTPLHMAAEAGESGLAEMLLAAKASPNATGAGLNTPLHYAVGRGATNLASLLLAHGADVNARNSDGQTPLLRAFSDVSNPDFAIVSLLLENHADPNLKSSAGGTALHQAVGYRRKDLVELLLAKGANPNLRDARDLTPLDYLKSSPPGPASPGMVRLGLPVPLPAPSGLRAVTASPTSAEPAELADLLRQHGATLDVPHLDRIELRRPAAGFAQTVFAKGTNDYNHFTLMELLAVHYGFVGLTALRSPAIGSPGIGFAPGGIEYTDSGFVRVGSLGFPKLETVTIRRPTPDGLGRTAITVNLTTIFRTRAISPSGLVCDCSRNPALEWGDVVEIPEADHPINAAWQGLADEDTAALHQCLDRHVQLTVKGQTTNLVLTLMTSRPAQVTVKYTGRVNAYPPAFSLVPVLHDSGMLRASSDLSRVKVRRRDPATGQSYELVFDCSDTGPSPVFWLRDGDVVEVPEKL